MEKNYYKKSMYSSTNGTFFYLYEWTKFEEDKVVGSTSSHQ